MKDIDNILADLLFAYVNKDEDLPHDFELDAVKKTVNYLLKNYQGSKYSDEFFRGTLEDIEDKRNFQ